MQLPIRQQFLATFPKIRRYFGISGHSDQAKPFVFGTPIQSSLVSLGKATAYPSEAPSRCALPTNIRPAWKGLPRTNALNYIRTFSVTNQIFMTLTPGQLLPSPLFLSRLKKQKKNNGFMESVGSWK